MCLSEQSFIAGIRPHVSEHLASKPREPRNQRWGRVNGQLFSATSGQLVSTLSCPAFVLWNRNLQLVSQKLEQLSLSGHVSKLTHITPTPFSCWLLLTVRLLDEGQIARLRNSGASIATEESLKRPQKAIMFTLKALRLPNTLMSGLTLPYFVSTSRTTQQSYPSGSTRLGHVSLRSGPAGRPCSTYATYRPARASGVSGRLCYRLS